MPLQISKDTIEEREPHFHCYCNSEPLNALQMQKHLDDCAEIDLEDP